MNRGNTKTTTATSNGNESRRDCLATVEDELEMTLKRFLKVGAALFLGGQGALAVIGIVTFLTQSEPPHVDGYGVTPIAEMTRLDQRS